MKTTELIPIILYQLVDGDRYGYEIIKQIEDSSKGNIIIKQPTLYSILKKLEQGRFISSYWQDSEIGGKRHYYKLTDNGKAQLSTYPPYETLIKESLEQEVVLPNSNVQQPIKNDVEDKAVENDTQNVLNNVEVVKEESVSQEPKIVPIDLTKTFSPINEDNSNFNIEPEIKDEDITNKVEATPSPTLNIFDAIDYNEDKEFISKYLEKNPPTTSIEEQETTQDIVDKSVESTQNIEDVSIQEKPLFTENIEPVVTFDSIDKFEDKATEVNLVDENSISTEEISTDNIEHVKFLNYIDFTTDKSTVKRRRVVNKHLQKMALTTFTLLCIMLLTLILCNKYSFSKVYFISITAVCLIIVFYPLLLLNQIPKLRLKYCSKPFKYSVSRDFFTKLSLFLSLIIVLFAYNLSLVKDFTTIFNLSNCANFLCPVLFGFGLMLDFLYSVIFYHKYY